MHESLFNILETVLEYIEENIKENITLEDISRKVNISKFYLCRIFKLITKKTLIEYLRSRKLSLSAYDMLNTSSKIVDIALKYNFDYEQSFIRSFKQEFKVSPHKFRKYKFPIKLTERLNLKFSQSINDSILFKSEIILKPSFYLIGKRYYIDIEDNRKTFLLTKLANDFYYTYRHEIKNSIRPNIYIGYIETILNNNSFCYYTTSIEVESLNFIPTGMTSYVVPTHKYIVFKYIGLHHPSRTTIKELSCVYEAIFSLIYNSNYNIADRFYFERVDMDFAKDDYCEVEILVPVIEKQ